MTITSGFIGTSVKGHICVPWSDNINTVVWKSTQHIYCIYRKDWPIMSAVTDGGSYTLGMSTVYTNVI